jgi:AraC-like DNA-binding protein
MYHIRHFVFQENMTIPYKPYSPRPEQCLIFYPKAPETVEIVNNGTSYQRPSSMFMGQYTCRTNRHVGKDFLVLIVDFQPGALHRLTGIPMSLLLNADLDATCIFPVPIRHAMEQLRNTNDYLGMIAVVERLIQKLVLCAKIDATPVDAICNVILSNTARYSLDWMAREACLSPRQLERKFNERIGVSPKTYARLARMHTSYKMKSRLPAEDWLSIAVASGYHDYQHLARDYKEFSGTTPPSLFMEDDRSPERILGMHDTF